MPSIFSKYHNKFESPVKEEKLVNDIIGLVRTGKNNFWAQKREQNGLSLFHRAALDVPAYKDFLKKNKVDPKKIKSFKDFESVPITNKNNYLKQYPLEDLCWNGSIKKPFVFTSTSGSTGEPFYFSRSAKIDWQSSIAHELYFKTCSSNAKQSTLVLVCFGMGVWIGGLITYQAFKLMSERGYPVSILTPGINKDEIFKALKRLATNFDQVILTGYPPFLKDIIDEAPERGIDLKKYNVKFLFAAEAFTESFRDYFTKKVSLAKPLLETMNIYGSADIGTMAFETPVSILLRRIAIKKPKLFASVFSNINKTPTLAQYNPLFLTFESPHGEILISGDNSIPLIRYFIGDNGGTYNFKDLMQKFKEHGVDISKEIKKSGIKNYSYELPFVYVFERKDMSTTLYGLQIYPETIKEVLLGKPFGDVLTGKLTLVTRYSDNQDQYLEINIELRKDKNNITPQFKKALLATINENLTKKNSEFKELTTYLKGKTLLKLMFWPAEYPQYFRPGIKQKWVMK